MPRGDKDAGTDKQHGRAGATEKSLPRKGVLRPDIEARGWASVEKFQGGKMITSRRKVPSGPVGGSGRKTNLSRSS